MTDKENWLIDQGPLAELLAAYKEQIQLLRDQLEEVRQQLAHRDRQIDELLRLLASHQDPRQTLPVAAAEPHPVAPLPCHDQESAELFQTIPLDEDFSLRHASKLARPAMEPESGAESTSFTREQLTASVLDLRRNGKSYEEITEALNRIGAAPFSGQPQWTVMETRSLLPPLVGSDVGQLTGQDEF